MSTRSSIFYSEDEGITIHVYHELSDDSPDNVRLEVQTPYACVNVGVPEDMRKQWGLRDLVAWQRAPMPTVEDQ